MESPPPAEVSSIERDAGTSLGEWLFRHRTIVVVPIAIALLAIPAGSTQSPAVIMSGAGLVVLAEIIRLWCVRYIGVISRTRSHRLGPLVSSGPFALVRNPLYLANILLWSGFAISAQLLWLVPLVLVLLGVHYHAIVKWEEQLLTAQVGDAYRRYAADVPRWIPRIRLQPPPSASAPHAWRDVLFSERGTLIAIAAGFFLLWLKARA